MQDKKWEDFLDKLAAILIILGCTAVCAAFVFLMVALGILLIHLA